MTAQSHNSFVFCVVVVELAVTGNQALSLVSIKPITTMTTTNFESKQSDYGEGWLLNLIVALFLRRGRGICRVMGTML